MTHQEMQEIAHRPVALLQSHLTSVIHALPSALLQDDAPAWRRTHQPMLLRSKSLRIYNVQ